MLTSFSFFVFLLITTVLYYLLKPLQKYILMIASLCFYLNISPFNYREMSLLILCICGVTYVGAIVIEKTNGRIKSVCLTICIVVLVTVLFVLKYAYNIINIISVLIDLNKEFSCIRFASVMGLSYYVLSAIGYVIDVYWGKYNAAKNPVDVAVFIFYFPQLVSGPITRFSNMSNQFNMRNALDYDNIINGMRRMAFGYLKKLVISERFGIIVTAVYGNYVDYSFVGVLGATLCYAIQLYTDFSGCMDIVMGASMLFGIELPENFCAPFFSETVQEFYQRWHITLGAWFKDYFMYPLQKSKPIQAMGKWLKVKFGKKFGKKVTFYMAMMSLWFLLGIWHGGTGYFFIASGIIPFTLLILGDCSQMKIKEIVSFWGINTDCWSWHALRRIKTLLLMCMVFFVICSGGTSNMLYIIRHMIANPINYTPIDTSMEVFGLGILDVCIMLVGVVVICISQKFEYEGTTLIKRMNEQNAVFRVFLIYAEILLIYLHGMVGVSEFIYFQF